MALNHTIFQEPGFFEKPGSLTIAGQRDGHFRESDRPLFAREFKLFLALSAIPYLIGRISLAYTPRIPTGFDGESLLSGVWLGFSRRALKRTAHSLSRFEIGFGYQPAIHSRAGGGTATPHCHQLCPPSA